MSYDNHHASRHDLVIARRQASWLVAGMIALIALAFVVGYVAGKRAVLRAIKHEYRVL